MVVDSSNEDLSPTSTEARVIEEPEEIESDSETNDDDDEWKSDGSIFDTSSVIDSNYDDESSEDGSCISDGYMSDDSLVNDIIRQERSDIPAVQLPDLSSSFSQHNSALASSSFVDDHLDQSKSIDKINDPDYTAEGSTPNSSKRIDQSIDNSKIQKNDKSISLLEQSKTDEELKSIPDYRKVKIDAATKSDTRKRRNHLCKFCFKDQSHLKRHLIRCHKNEPEVQKMIQLTASKSSSRKPMKQLLHSGDYEYNTNEKLFKGEFRVARKPTKSSYVSEYVSCPTCKVSCKEKDFRKHIIKCAGIDGKYCRNLAQLGRKMLPNCHSQASKKMRTYICRMRDDEVLRALKYDKLIVEFGNEISQHLRGNQHKANICAKLRRLGRLKLKMNVDSFSDILVPAKSLDLVKTIELMAVDPNNPNSDYLLYPTLAENLATLVKQIANTHSVLCLRENNLNIKDTTENFLKCFTNDFNRRLSRMVSESHGKQKRQKKIQLPSATDIRLLYEYLSKERKKHYNLLEEEFNEKSYLELLKCTLTSLQVFNRRRPGDVERIYIHEFENRQKIKNESKSYYEKLPEGMRDLVDEFSLIETRGKWANNLKLLVPPDVELCLLKIIKLRTKLKISSKNDYLFALPKTPLCLIRHPSAYVLLTRYAELCGAEQPNLLRATKLRKHLATACIELNLTDAELHDLCAYMGHHLDIHKSHYRRNIVARDIPLFLKFVSKALEGKSNSDDSDLDEENSVLEEESLTENIPQPDNERLELEDDEGNEAPQSLTNNRKRGRDDSSESISKSPKEINVPKKKDG